ncbi:hypothetical protein Sste5346_003405 [Sporothrix stenoceras]|uniref:Zn(2)-C6 fungal-type domain-containing protein n=1 Tax=Sporothrix stenoceras TaxID=5173 RepID=A0ABR3ZCU6_9PEZI
MRLRRGMVRESCDFCHRRKIKCDRLSRNDLGHTACSQCSLRSVECCMDDSDDIRLKGRCRQTLSPAILPPSSAIQTPTTSVRRTLRHKGVGQGVGQGPSPQSPLAARTGGSLATAASPVSTISLSSMDETANYSRPQHQHISPAIPTPSLATPVSMNLEVNHVDTVDGLLSQTQTQTSGLSYNTINTTSSINTISSSINAPPSSSMTEDLMFLDDPFHLNADSIFFLDQIFTGYPDGPAYGSAPSWPNMSSSSDLQPLVLNPLQQQSMQQTVQPTQPMDSNTSQQPQQYQQQEQQSSPQPPQPPQPSQSQQQREYSQPPPQQPEGSRDGGYDPPPWTRCGLDKTTFLDALRAYFSYTTLYLPILLEDAFWQDYHAGRCSLSIIYAVACRGLPFAFPPTPTLDRKLIWSQQQRVAEQFREAFFAAQLSANKNRGRVRLDDLEALALMVQFKYREVPDNAESRGSSLSQLHAHLAGLYLTHDSLVLMTMQSGIDVPEDPASQLPSHTTTATSSTDPTAPLARLNDRRTLLFWHVYGLDSFHCLDKKTLSRIPDCNHHLLLPVSCTLSAPAAMTSPKNLPNIPRHPEEARGYLDAVLDLAVIARKALVTLSNATARRSGIRADKLEAVYAMLGQWQRTTCPPHLRRQKDAQGQLSMAVGADGGQIQLHRAVVWILEINCYLQIEDCVAEYGIYEDAKQKTPSLDRETLALRVEAETVRQLRDSVEIARSILAYDKSSRKGTTFSLPDLGTSIVRDCCYGLSQWASFRGQEKLKYPPRAMQGRAAAASENESAIKHKIMATYLEAATVLRDAAATAVSHADTQAYIDNLDTRIDALTAAMEEIAPK